MKVLVTGSRGFIGKHLIKKLKEKGIDFIEFEGDIRTFGDLKKLKADAVIHLAAKTFVPDSFKNPRDFYEANILGTLNVLEFCRINKAKLIFISSYVYGNPRYLPINEKHEVNLHSPYNESKYLGEKLCEYYHKNFNIKCIIFRQFNVYGPGQTRFLIPNIISQLNKKEIVLDNPAPKRDFIYVSDAVEAYIKALNFNADFEIFNLGSGKSYSVKTVAELILKLSKGKSKLKFTGEKRPNEVIDTRADINKIKKVLGWGPTVGLEDGIKRCLGSGNA